MTLRSACTTLLVLTLAACASQPARETTPVAASPAHDNLDATLWMQSAAEYEATVRGSFAQAQQALDAALADRCRDVLPEGERTADPCGLPPAIITDADETLIDNTPFQARKIRDGVGFVYENWLAWVNERNARALPGAVEFAQYAASRGVTLYYVTNRDAPAEVAATADNLRKLGFPVAAGNGNLLLRGDARAPGREKGERRRWVGQRHRVVLMLGDNLGDFLDGINTTVAAREARIAEHATRWGRDWIMLPNPSYGSWESAVLRACGETGQADPGACKRAALRLN